MHEETRRAVDALGKGLGRDWILEPQKHASSLPAEAGALQRILVTKPVQQTISRFKLHDEAAGPAQKRAIRWATMMIWAPTVLVCLAVVFAGVPVRSWYGLRMELGLLIVLIATYLMLIAMRYMSEARSWQRKWHSEREQAEGLRRELFEKVIGVEEAARLGEIAPLPLKLEYFRRYQLDVQKAYFKEQGPKLIGEARSLERHLLLWRIVTDLLFFLVTAGIALVALAPMVEQGPVNRFLQAGSALVGARSETAWAVTLAVLVAIATVVSLALIAQIQVKQRKRNGMRYRSTLESLERLESYGLDVAREAAAEGNAEEVKRFVAAIHEVMKAEFAEWIDTDGTAKPST